MILRRQKILAYLGSKVTHFGKGCYWGSYCVCVCGFGVRCILGQGPFLRRACCLPTKVCCCQPGSPLLLDSQLWSLLATLRSAHRNKPIPPNPCWPTLWCAQIFHPSRQQLLLISMGPQGFLGILFPLSFWLHPFNSQPAAPWGGSGKVQIWPKPQIKKWLKTFWLCMGNLLAEILIKKFYFCTTCKERTRKFVEKLLACSSFQEKISLVF